jgi:hypothetical protein
MNKARCSADSISASCLSRFTDQIVLSLSEDTQKLESSRIIMHVQLKLEPYVFAAYGQFDSSSEVLLVKSEVTQHNGLAT